MDLNHSLISEPANVSESEWSGNWYVKIAPPIGAPYTKGPYNGKLEAIDANKNLSQSSKYRVTYFEGL